LCTALGEDVEKKDSERVIIKKYPNRRLYDTKNSSYVTLREVARMIKEGDDVEVIDAKSEEDVTAFILTQIVLEETRRKNSLLPVSLLHLIIRYGENVLSEFFEKYLELTIENYLTYKAAVDDQFKKWLELGMDLSAMGQKAMLNLPPFKPFYDIFSEATDKGKKDRS